MQVNSALQLKNHLDLLELHIKKYLDPDDPLMAKNLQAVFTAGGKRVRPSLSYLCARIGDPHITPERILPLEAALEMIHTASLIHDDIIDDSPLRRGQPTLHTLVGKTSAILNGDYLLGKAIAAVEIYENPELIRILADTSREMCLGEFQQMSSAYSHQKQNNAHYFSQIRRKTARLFSGCCETGAIIGGLSELQQKALHCYGNFLGIAFQMSDDILDFCGNQQFGKPLGQDLQQGIFTLPLLYTLKHSDRKNRLIASAEKREKGPEDIAFIIGEVVACGGISHTKEMVNLFSKKAISALKPLPDCAEKQLLTHMAIKMANRER